MKAPPIPTAAERDQLAALGAALDRGEVGACCAAVFANPAVRWLLDDELHPGGEKVTRRLLADVAPGPGEDLLDIASGAGDTALLAAREYGCTVTGVDLSDEAVAGATASAAAAGLADRVRFLSADAGRLPLPDRSFDVVVCECALCTFGDKPGAVAEMRRLLRPGGRIALSDVVADHRRLPEGLRGTMATVACIGGALDAEGYESLLAAEGFELMATEDAVAETAALADRVRSRLRAAKILGMDALAPIEGGLARAVELAGQAEAAIAEGALGYRLFAARLG